MDPYPLFLPSLLHLLCFPHKDQARREEDNSTVVFIFLFFFSAHISCCCFSCAAQLKAFPFNYKPRDESGFALISLFLRQRRRQNSKLNLWKKKKCSQSQLFTNISSYFAHYCSVGCRTKSLKLHDVFQR